MSSISFTVPCLPIAQPRKFTHWTPDEMAVLREQYPKIGRLAAARLLGRTAASVRYKASLMGLSLDRTSEFWSEFQSRAAESKVGRKRPAQALVMKHLHAIGKLGRTTPAQRKAMSERQKNWIAENGHPRGALGHRHSPESLSKMGDAARRTWKMKTQKQKQARTVKMLETRLARYGSLSPDRKRGTWKAAWRTIGGKRKFYRSRWEANYARFLEWRRERGEVADWSHEPETFWFKGIKRGCVSYLPDFRVTMPDGAVEYHEVKGWMDAASKTKIKRMKKYHPSVVLVVIDSKSYRSLDKLLKNTVPEWE